MDPQVEALLQMMAAQAAASGAPQTWELPGAVARANAEQTFVAFNQPMPEGVAIADSTVPGPAGAIPVKVFTPVGAGPFPLVVYFHMGGFVIGSPNTQQKLCAEFALGSGAVVVSVDYRLAPEHPAPAALDDCVAATRYAVSHASEFGADGSRYALAGDSAGANLVAGVALQLRDAGAPPAKLLLMLYGCFTGRTDLPSFDENGQGKLLTTKTMAWFYEQYLAGSSLTIDDPRVSPINANLRGLPPSRLIVGTQDPLLDDSKRFAKALQDAGVPTTLSVYQDQIHVFLQMTAILDGAKKGMAEACEALKTALN